MMKKSLFFILVLLFLSNGVANAQNSTRAEFSNLYSSYRTKYDEYLKEHDDYILAKGQFEKFDTLSSRENAQVETSQMLIKRDEVMVSYLTALRARLDDTSLELDAARKSELKSLIDTETQWYNEHKSKIRSNLTLKELVILSNEAETHSYENNNVIYLNLFEISKARMIRYDIRFTDFFDRLKNLTEVIKAEKRDQYKLSDGKIERIDRWIGEVNNKDEQYDKYMDEAVQFTPVQGDKNQSRGMYNEAIKRMQDALEVLKLRISYAVEVIEEIKVSER